MVNLQRRASYHSCSNGQRFPASLTGLARSMALSKPPLLI